MVGLVFDFLGFYALYLSISLSLNLEFGYAGIPNFGKVLFIAGGAAFAGSITGRLAAWILGVGKGLPYITDNFLIMNQINPILAKDPVLTIELVLLGLAIAGVIGAVLGYVFSYPAIHLREDYLGLLLLGMAQLFYIILTEYTPLVGGTQTILVPNPYYYFSTLGINDLTDVVSALVMLAFAGLVYLYVERVARSPLGRVLRAMRDSDEAASALGKDTAKMRRNALMIASALGGMAGAMFTFSVASVGADTWTRFAWTFWPFLIVIMGGVANNTGVALGSFFFVLILKGLELVQPYLQPFIFFNVSWLQDLLFAGLLIAILYIRPEGIIRERSTFTLSPDDLRSVIGKKGDDGTEGG
ncbi:MAG: branched-chain amino acid ABC transporter permease [Nitrososphaerota archaeon]|nr:branched-chain amino acid ABC transporter permease [Nitrososphaerota archaeon]